MEYEPPRCTIVLLILLGAAALLVGCGRSTGEADSAWTVEEGALALEETLRLTEGEDFYIGEIYDVAVREDGRIYVADGQAGHVKVFAADGTLLRTIGRQGEGPGEFRYPSRLELASGDSLYVMDARGVSVFSSEGDFEYAFSVVGGADAPRNMMIPPGKSGAFFAFFPFPRQAAETTARTVVCHVGSDGEVGDTLFAVRPNQVGPEGRPLPFSRRALFDMGPEGLMHHACSGSLHVATYDQQGVKQRSIEIPFDPIPVRLEDLEIALKDRSKAERAAVREHIPDTKPAFEYFLVDDEGRYWFGRPTAHPDSVAWWVAQPDEQRVVTGTLPDEVRLMTVRDGHAYGRTTTEDGAPALVRFRVSTGT